MGTIRHLAAMAATKRAGSGHLCSSLVALVAAFTMAACGGGSSAPEETPAASLNLLGTASAEAAMPGAAVSVKCASGPSQTITAGDGTFALAIRSGALPCMIEVSSGGRVYRSLVLGSGTGTYRVNANPLTELVVARVASLNNSTPTALFTAFSANNAALTSAALDGALSYLRTAFAALADLNGFNPMSDVVVGGQHHLVCKRHGKQDQHLPGTSHGSQHHAGRPGRDGAQQPDRARAADAESDCSAALHERGSAAGGHVSVLASSVLTPSYQWQVSADGGVSFGDITGATGASYTVATTQTTDDGRVFRVRVYSAGGSDTSSGATLSVTAPAPTAPVITTQPQSASAPYGQAGELQRQRPAGGLAMSYQWSRNGSEIPGATNASLTIPMTVPGDNGASFVVTATNSSGSTVSAAAILTGDRHSGCGTPACGSRLLTLGGGAWRRQRGELGQHQGRHRHVAERPDGGRQRPPSSPVRPPWPRTLQARCSAVRRPSPPASGQPWC